MTIQEKENRIKELKTLIEDSLNCVFDDWETRIKLRKELKELEES